MYVSFWAHIKIASCIVEHLNAAKKDRATDMGNMHEKLGENYDTIRYEMLF